MYGVIFALPPIAASRDVGIKGFEPPLYASAILVFPAHDESSTEAELYGLLPSVVLIVALLSCVLVLSNTEAESYGLMPAIVAVVLYGLLVAMAGIELALFDRLLP